MLLTSLERFHLEIIVMLLISLLTLSACFTELELFGYDTIGEKNLIFSSISYLKVFSTLCMLKVFQKVNIESNFSKRIEDFSLRKRDSMTTLGHKAHFFPLGKLKFRRHHSCFSRA